MKKKKKYSREDVIEEIWKLALCPVNDAVLLCCMSEEAPLPLEKLDLRCLTEFKRNGNGGIELRFIDRLKALEVLLVHMDAERGETAAAFLQSLGDPGGGA